MFSHCSPFLLMLAICDYSLLCKYWKLCYPCLTWTYKESIPYHLIPFDLNTTPPFYPTIVFIDWINPSISSKTQLIKWGWVFHWHARMYIMAPYTAHPLLYIPFIEVRICRSRSWVSFTYFLPSTWHLQEAKF